MNKYMALFDASFSRLLGLSPRLRLSREILGTQRGAIR
jgi:hypothetical protein